VAAVGKLDDEVAIATSIPDLNDRDDLQVQRVVRPDDPDDPTTVGRIAFVRSVRLSLKGWTPKEAIGGCGSARRSDPRTR
jgi:hypothetical protein